MTEREEHARVKALFGKLADLPQTEREAVLAACTEAPAVIAEVRRLLASNPPTERFEQPVLDAMRVLAATPLQSNATLGAWTLGEEIGHGGMGLVFRARRSDGHFEQEAAVKVLGGVASPQALARLASERQILATLVHPHIARLLDGGATASGQPYLVMEFIAGVPIDQYVREGRLGMRDTLRLLLPVCAAVAHAHRNLVVHCDLKPSNILVTAEGRPVLLDFGVSRLLNAASPGDGEVERSSDNPLATSAGYTRLYASPEQLAQARVGTATDIYSLGVMLAELLGVSFTDAQAMPLGSLPRDLAAIIARATRNEPAERYPGADALAADLEAFLGHRPVAARGGGLIYLGGRWLRRHWPWALAAAVFVLSVGTLYVQMREERNNALLAEQRALAVKDYMVAVFQGADPEVAGQRDLKVSEVLDASRLRLAAMLNEQPTLRTELTGILAGVYHNLGKREQAVGMFEEAIAEERRLGRPLMLASLLHRKANTLYDAEEFARAEPVALEALALRERHQPDSTELVDTLRLLGSIQGYLERADEAYATLDRALVLARAIKGDESVEAARVRTDIGRAKIFLDPQPIEAIAPLEQARAALAAKVGREHHWYINNLEILSIALGNTGRLDDAIPMAREVAAQRARLYGEISNQNGYGLYSLAHLLGRAGQRLEAMALLRQCLQIQRQLDGNDTAASEVPLSLLADLTLEVGEIEDAEKLLRELIELRRQLMPDNPHALLSAEWRLARIERLRGRWVEAEARLDAVMATALGNANTHPYRIIDLRLERAALHRVRGQFDQASAELAAIDPASYAGDDRPGGRIDAEAARLLAARGELRAAVTAMAAAETRLERGLLVGHPDVARMQLERAEWLLQLGELEAARSLWTQARARAAPALSPTGLLASQLDRIEQALR